jgi:hypothetical protein
MATAWSMVDVLKKTGPNLTRQNLLENLNNFSETDNPFVYNGIPVKNSPSDHYTITQEYIAKYDAANSVWKPISQPIDVRGQIKYP